jgi:pimeloyl-ACP methyl ester carboxylesterase
MSADLADLPLVLSPGLEGTGTLFGPFVEALGPAAATRIVSYGDRRKSLAAHADDVVQALDRAASPAVLVGESFGGPVAITAAAKRPEQVHALILVATFVTTPVQHLDRLQRLFRLVTTLPSSRRLRREVFRWSHCDPRGDPEVAEQLARVNAPERAALQAHRLGLLVDLDLRAELRALPCPVAYLAGATDRIVPTHRHARVILEARSDAWVRLLPAGPHQLLQCRPVECVELMRRFLRAVADAPSARAV